MFCRAKGCKCGLFLYIPVHGGQDFKCHCKHSHTVHSVQGNRACQRPGCRCDRFSSSFACSCGQFFGDHETIFESRAEREAAGRPVDNLGMRGVYRTTVLTHTDASYAAFGCPIVFRVCMFPGLHASKSLVSAISCDLFSIVSIEL